ncbi:PilZ domain-containing protein [Pelagibacterium halotolerans]|uniref:PilZ domain-containing protein n=1 Tax=Pelagibacterium halotolerans TaxID=531813 RepID=UPI00384B33F8
MQTKPSHQPQGGVRVTLPASYTLAGPENRPVTVYRCRTRAIALDHIEVEAETLPPEDAKVYLNISGLGVCAGVVRETVPHGFILSIAPDADAIAKLMPRVSALRRTGRTGEDLRVFATLPACYTIAGTGLDDGRATVYPCRTRAIALDRIVIEAEAAPPQDAIIYLNISGLGVCRARVSKILSNGFVAAISLDAEVIAKLVPRLDWLKRHLAGTADDRRDHRRFPTPRYAVRLAGEGGLAAEATTQDLSRSGLAVLTDALPAIGAHLTLGGMPGEVVRLFEGGLAVRFDTPHPLGEVREQLLRQK